MFSLSNLLSKLPRFDFVGWFQQPALADVDPRVAHRAITIAKFRAKIYQCDEHKTEICVQKNADGTRFILIVKLTLYFSIKFTKKHSEYKLRNSDNYLVQAGFRARYWCRKLCT